MNSISDELKRIAYRFILVDEELLPLAVVGRKEEPKTWLEKAWDSLKELGNGIMDASNERYEKRYSSVWSFLDYWTAGIPKGAYQGYVERADKLFDSPNDFANGMTFGVHGTFREAIIPTKAWSTEHVASIIGAAGIATGATVPLMKPKDILSPRVQYEVRKSNDGLKRDAGGDGGKGRTVGKDNFEQDLYRKSSNTGAFENLSEPMQLRHVEKIAEDAGIGLKGIKIEIVRDAELIGKDLYGWADPKGNRILLYPDAFSSKENLVKTLGHERIHIYQTKTFGKPLDYEMLIEFEKGAYGSEDAWWEYFKRKGR
ncbi:hypothetical protein [Paenibacillus lactis]